MKCGGVACGPELFKPREGRSSCSWEKTWLARQEFTLLSSVFSWTPGLYRKLSTLEHAPHPRIWISFYLQNDTGASIQLDCPPYKTHPLPWMFNGSGPRPFRHMKPGSWKTGFALIEGTAWEHGFRNGCSLPACLLRPSIVSDSLRPHGWKPTRLLCPWDSPGKNSGASCHFLLQGNLPDPGIEPVSPASPALAGGFCPTESLGKMVQCVSIISSKFKSHIRSWSLGTTVQTNESLMRSSIILPDFIER